MRSPTKTPFRTLGQRRCDPPQQQQPQLVRTPSLGIEYCSRCNWMLRSAWLGQELLTTFNASLAEVPRKKSPLPRCASQHLSARRPTAQVRLLPNAVEAGVFNVTLTTEGAVRALGWNTPHIPSGLPFDPGAGSVLVWNRAEEHCRPGGVGLDVVSSRLQV